MHIFRGFYPTVDQKMKKVRYVVGSVKEPLALGDDEKVLFTGDCTCWEGSINGKKLKIKNSYRHPHEIDEHKTASNDMLRKTFQTLWSCLRNRNSRYLRAGGCPVSVADHVHYLSAMAGIKNVNFDPRLVFPVNMDYWKMRFYRLINRIFGHKI